MRVNTKIKIVFPLSSLNLGEKRKIVIEGVIKWIDERAGQIGGVFVEPSPHKETFLLFKKFIQEGFSRKI